MTVVEIANGILTGLTADTKPTTYPNGTIFLDTQTGARWMYISAAWTLITVPEASLTLSNMIGPLSVAKGGTGAATLTGILKGGGTSAFSAVTAPSGAIVGDTDTQTLTNKTLMSPIISTISNTGTVTLPTSTDTLVGKATTDVLTNKTLTSPAITDPVISTTYGASTAFPSVLPSPSTGRWGFILPTASSTTGVTGMYAGTLVTATATGSGTFGGVVTSSVGARGRYATGSSINSICGAKLASLMTERDLNPWIQLKCQISVVTTLRFFFGFQSTVTAPTSTADSLANLSGVGFKFDTGVHATNISVMQNDGSASSDSTTVSNVGTMDTAVHTYAVRALNSGTKFQVSMDGAAWTDINTKIPAASTTITPHWFIETLTAAGKNFDVWYVQQIQDP